ncbi:alcohol dehydrogenase [Spirochaetia bacterium]|nr:alcohol dehydrogenase [Spirochaetia bacterium]
MDSSYFMPTRVIIGDDCIFSNRALLKDLGEKALIVSGKSSAKANGSLADMARALEANGQSSFLYDSVMSNPTVDCIYEAAEAVKREGCDFVVGLGGGSPLDAAKGAAVLALNPVEKSGLFSAAFTRALPIVAVPTTAGTGSEVTPTAVLTNHAAKTKTSLKFPALFPRFAFLDAKYTLGLSRATTINTAVDALTHAVEGMLSRTAGALTDTLAKESVAVVAGCFGALSGDRELDMGIRQKLLYAAMLAGMVIANTGTNVVHSMGYSLTYHRNIDHGRANGLIFAEFLRAIEQKEKNSDSKRIPVILSCLKVRSPDEFAGILDGLFGKKETFTAAELEQYAEQASKARSIANGIFRFEKAELLDIFKKSIG